jgi:hypothetical protein
MVPTTLTTDEWDDDRLRAEFDPFGTITSCRVMKDDKGVSKVSNPWPRSPDRRTSVSSATLLPTRRPKLSPR